MAAKTQKSTNPFEDSHVPLQQHQRTSSNPFDLPEDVVPPPNPQAARTKTRPTVSNPFDSEAEGDDPGPVQSAMDSNPGGNSSSGGGSVNATSEPNPSAEASWQYLGDLPYRRIPIYQNVHWSDSSSSSGSSGLFGGGTSSTGLAQFPASLTGNNAKSATGAALLDAREMRQWIQTSTVTQVEGCPHGGPIAAVTLPLHNNRSSSASSSSSHRFISTEVRILSNAGQLLAKIPFPQQQQQQQQQLEGSNSDGSSANKTPTTNPSGTPQKAPSQQTTQKASQQAAYAQQKYQRSAADIFKIGFTERGILVVLMRDSLCLTYDIHGQPVLPPFFLLHGHGNGGELMRAHIYGQGVACLAHNKQVAICEFLHQALDMQYLHGAHVTAREIRASANGNDPSLVSSGYSVASNMIVALVTPLSVATEWCATNFKSFRTVAVLPRHCTSHGRPEVFLSTDDHSVVVVPVSASMELVDVECRHRISSPIVDMSFCPNGRFLACFTEQSMLTVMSTTFETKVLDFDTSEGSTAPPLSMCWCGEDSVVLHWKNMGILAVGPYGDWLFIRDYNNTSSVYLIPEMDACRVITDSSVELLQRVPPMTANLLRIGSIEGSALLLEAADAFGSGSVSDDVLLSDNPPKEEDIAVCIEAALKEFDIATQKRLLRAASYGMQFMKQKQSSNPNSNLVMGGPSFHPEEDGDRGSEVILPSATTRLFVDAARKLRILNALRNPEVGFILTAAQYDTLTPTGVLGRLIAMQRPALASRLAVYLRLPKAVQLYARASKAAAYVQKVHTLGTAEAQSDTITAEKAIAIIQNESEGSETTDEDAAKNPISKNKNNSSMYRGAYATVAMAATKAGRSGVANLLLLLESSVSDKVPALISNGSFVDAMAVATLARDGDYIFSTLMQLEKACLATATNPNEISKAQTTFWQTVIAKLPPEAFHVLRRFYLASGATAAGDSGGSSAVNLLLRAQRFTDAGAALAKRALVEEDPREQQGILQESSRVFSLGKDTLFYKTCTDEYMELLKDQETIRTKYGSSEVAPPSTSVTATLVSVLNYAATHVREQHRLLSDADKIAKKFRIPDRRVWHIKVKAFADSKQWSNLRVLADSRSKSPIGYAPFARAAIRGKQPAAEIMKYVDKITSAEERCDLLAEAGMWKRALEEAIRLRDLQRIHNVKARCNSPELQMQAEQAIGKLA